MRCITSGAAIGPLAGKLNPICIRASPLIYHGGCPSRPSPSPPVAEPGNHARIAADAGGKPAPGETDTHVASPRQAAGSQRLMDAQILLENALNACVAGLVIGRVYGLMC